MQPAPHSPLHRLPRAGRAALSFELPTAADAEDFRCAFYRFVELKSRAVVDPRAGCSLAIQRVGSRRVAEVGLWSRTAAAEFAGFWPKYAGVYGRGSPLKG